MNVLILGKDGQVGKALAPLFPKAKILGRSELDLASPGSIKAVLQKLKPDIIINAAAYTAVDAAESDADLAFSVNEHAVQVLAEYAAANDSWLIHFSTDYVFSGDKPSAYSEEDDTAPTGIYGHSKLAGEQAIQRLCTRYYIFRTSWVFAEEGANFVNTMLRLARERDELGVVSDQVGCPTYAGDIAQIVSRVTTRLVQAAEHNIPAGIYHLSGNGALSWHDFAEEIFQCAHASGLITRIPKLKAISTAEYPTAAQRPANSVLDTTKLEQALDTSLPHWSGGLQKLLAASQGANRR